jgi:hypothetical protein
MYLCVVAAVWLTETLQVVPYPQSVSLVPVVMS